MYTGYDRGASTDLQYYSACSSEVIVKSCVFLVSCFLFLELTELTD